MSLASLDRAAGPSTGPSARPVLRPGSRRTVVVAVGLAAVGGIAAAALPLPVVAGAAAVLAAVAVVLATARRPDLAAPAYVTALPFLAGLPRDTPVPGLRANEVLLVLVLAGAALGAAARAHPRPGGLPGSRAVSEPRWRLPAIRPAERALVVFVLLGTVWPLASLVVRGTLPTGAEVAAVAPLLKLAALYVLVRATVHGAAAVLRLLRLVVWPATVVAVVAVLQVLQVAPVLASLMALWGSDDPPEALAERGTTTLASPLATGDYLVIALVLLVALGARGLLRRSELIVAGPVLVAGVVAVGQFSAWISAVVAAVVVLVRHPGLRRPALRALVPVGLVAAVAAPALAGRLADFGAGVPVSWLTRWDNLSTFYLPRLLDGGAVLGVSPDPVLAAPETWRDRIWLESGYLQLLWVGGIALLAAFGWLSVVVLRAARRAASAPGTAGAVGTALGICWWTILVVSLLDAHLTLRGTGDLLAVLLALVLGGAAATAGAPGTAAGVPGPAAGVPGTAEGASGTAAGVPGTAEGAPGTAEGRPGTASRPRARLTRPAPRPRPAEPMRRALDVVLASAALLLLAPLLLFVAVAVRCGSRGPALLRQRRVGLDRMPFTMLKFRTMRVGADDEALRALIAAELRGEDTVVGGSSKIAADPRVTRLGAVLRRTSVDELPQLLNVLRGQMALVGPRPCLEWEADMFPAAFDARFSVRPGITGVWQTGGRSTVATLEMLRMDMDYVRSRSLAVDLRIMARTVPVLLRGDGAR